MSNLSISKRTAYNSAAFDGKLNPSFSPSMRLGPIAYMFAFLAAATGFILTLVIFQLVYNIWKVWVLLHGRRRCTLRHADHFNLRSMLSARPKRRTGPIITF